MNRKDIVSIDVARDGMEKVVRCLATCPRDVQVDSLGWLENSEIIIFPIAWVFIHIIDNNYAKR